MHVLMCEYMYVYACACMYISVWRPEISSLITLHFIYAGRFSHLNPVIINSKSLASQFVPGIPRSVQVLLGDHECTFSQLIDQGNGYAYQSLYIYLSINISIFFQSALTLCSM